MKRERIGVYLDLENLLYQPWTAGDTTAGLLTIGPVLQALSCRGTVVASVACCHPSLANEVSVPLSTFGVRTFTHRGGPDGADMVLLQQMEDLPGSVDTLIIGSGDHAFTTAAQDQVRFGRTVEVVAREGNISADLYRAVSQVHFLPKVDPVLMAIAGARAAA